MKEYCENCGGEITSEPIIKEEEERTFVMSGDGIDNVETTAPFIIYFCSEECKKEYYEPNPKV